MVQILLFSSEAKSWAFFPPPLKSIPLPTGVTDPNPVAILLFFFLSVPCLMAVSGFFFSTFSGAEVFFFSARVNVPPHGISHLWSWRCRFRVQHLFMRLIGLFFLFSHELRLLREAASPPRFI